LNFNVFFSFSHYSISTLDARLPFFWYLDLPHSVHVYIRFVFLVVFRFFFAWFFIREYFPLLPMPRHKPRSFILTLLPRFIELGLPLLGSLTFCSVFFLQ